MGSGLDSGRWAGASDTVILHRRGCEGVDRENYVDESWVSTYRKRYKFIYLAGEYWKVGLQRDRVDPI